MSLYRDTTEWMNLYTLWERTDEAARWGVETFSAVERIRKLAAMAAAIESAESGELSEEQQTRQRVLLTIALETLEDLIENGFADLELLIQDAALTSLRELPEFQQLLDSPPAAPSGEASRIDLLSQINVSTHAVSGRWAIESGCLTSPKEYAARIEIPYSPEGIID